MVFALPVDAAIIAYTMEVCQANAVDIGWSGVREGLIKSSASIAISGNPCRTRPELRLSVIESDVKVASYTVHPSLIITVPAMVAKDAVGAGERLSLVSGEAILGQFSGVLLTDGPLLAKSALVAGQPVTSQNTLTAFDAHAGDPVDILVRTGDLTIRASGQLLADAVMGETVRVKNNATGTAQRATLTGPTTVELSR